MKVKIKKFGIDLEVKNKGLEFEVREVKGTHLGDCSVTKTGLVWHPGKTRSGNGKKKSWNDFINWMNSE